MNEFEIPVQIEMLIQSLRNKKDGDHIRNNYRMRLQSIRDKIDAELKEFDNEMIERMRKR